MTTVKDRRRKSPRTHLADYLEEIDATPLLSADEEKELARRVAAGDPAARDRMVRANLRLVVAIAKRYAGKGLPMDDLVAEGNLGLLRAVEAFDPAMDTRFSTYASWWVKQSVRRALTATGRVVRVPHYVGGLLAKWHRAAAELREETGTAPADADVAARLGLTRGQTRAVRSALKANAAIQPDDPAVADWAGDAIADDRTAAPDEWVADAEAVGVALGALDRLDEREAAVVRLRYGLDGGEPMTLREIGERIGYTRERARQIEQAALSKLRGFVDAA